MDKDEESRQGNAEQQIDNRAYDPQEVEPSTDVNAPVDAPPVPPSLPPQAVEVSEPVGTFPGPQQKTRRKWLLPIIIAVALVVVGGSSALAYKFWYQNPEKVISDSLMHAIEAKSMTYTMTAEHKDASMDVTVVLAGASKDGANSVDANVSVMAGGQKHTFKGSAVVDKKSDIYIKVANVDTLLAEFTAAMPANVRQSVNDFIKKINDQWIVISNDKLKSFSESYAKTQKCMQSVSETLQNDTSYTSELVDLYKAHPFLKITKELGSKDGSLGYEVRDNEAAGKAFGEGLKNTKTYKLLHGCDSSFTIDTDGSTGSTSDDTTTAQIWVSRWTHEITKVTASEKGSDGTTSVGFEPMFNGSADVKTPANAKSVEDLMKDIQALELELMNASMQAAPTQSSSLFS